ncbi:GntR family transcriptional regulator [Streptomyces sp. C10-9-1]|uniref:GntR family transcriptional regulator n=1 Tax=Streptomyces sp. C10-9-1 TaxID=1859285 RepID=UPI0027E4F20E|nr:GntR family transcriptional regulator [Streptomyces sp. C10-9-1]
MTPTVPTLRDTIAEDLRTQITAGHLKPGDRLPSEPKLATHYKVSTPTVRQALALLQAEGLIEKTHGKGNFVRAPLRRITYTGGAGMPFAPDIQTTIRTTNLRARGHIRTLLKVPPNTPLTEFDCTTYEGETPRSVARIYIPRDLAPAAQLASSSWPGSWDAARTETRETVTARLPTREEASALRISTTRTVLTITSIALNSAGRVIEAALLAFPSDAADAVFTTHPTLKERGDRQMTSRDELRLLPWSGPDGKPCFLSTDGDSSRMSRLADTLERTYLDQAAEVLDRAIELLSLPKPDPVALHATSADLTEALGQVLRVAESRGRRLP